MNQTDEIRANIERMLVENEAFRKTIVYIIENTKTNMTAAMDEIVRLADDNAALRERVEAAERDFGLLKNRAHPCEVCAKNLCYCSSGGSACKGFEWRGPVASDQSRSDKERKQ